MTVFSFSVLKKYFQGFCALDDQLLTEEGSGFEPPPIVNITVELVSNRSFDPEKNASNLKIVKDAVSIRFGPRTKIIIFRLMIIPKRRILGTHLTISNNQLLITEESLQFFLRSVMTQDVMKFAVLLKEQRSTQMNFHMLF